MREEARQPGVNIYLGATQIRAFPILPQSLLTPPPTGGRGYSYPFYKGGGNERGCMASRRVQAWVSVKLKTGLSESQTLV